MPAALVIEMGTTDCLSISGNFRERPRTAEKPYASTSVVSVMDWSSGWQIYGPGPWIKLTKCQPVESLSTVIGRNQKRWAMMWHTGLAMQFSSTIQADLVRPLFDCEHAAEVTVMTAKGELKHPTQRVHRS